MRSIHPLFLVHNHHPEKRWVDWGCYGFLLPLYWCVLRSARSDPSLLLAFLYCDFRFLYKPVLFQVFRHRALPSSPNATRQDRLLLHVSTIPETPCGSHKGCIHPFFLFVKSHILLRHSGKLCIPQVGGTSC